jgi:hypothetical protein
MKLRKNSKQLRDASASATTITRYDLDSGFVGTSITTMTPADVVRHYIDRRGAYVTRDDDGRCVLHVHSNLWYELTTSA